MKKDYKDDLKEIRNMMDRSSRFISLSGLSGISAGIIAIIGAYIAHQHIFQHTDLLQFERIMLSWDTIIEFILIASATLIAALVTTVYFTTRETKKRNQKIWDRQSRQLIIQLMIPLIAGDITCTILLINGFLGMVLPLSLIFYGLALINGSKYTLSEVRTLGIVQVILGLMALWLIQYGLIVWAIGFGLVHILYGIFMQMKYKA